MLIHQIWLNPEGDPPPAHCRKWMKGWEKCGDYHLWTPKNLPEPKHLDLLEWCQKRWSHNKRFFYKAASDIWRYQLLEDMGGFYVDIDCELLGEFALLVPTNNATVYSPKSPGTGIWWKTLHPDNCCNGLLFAPEPQHRIWGQLLAVIRQNTIVRNINEFPDKTTGPLVLRHLWRPAGMSRVEHPTVSFYENVTDETVAVFHMKWATRRYE